VTARLIVLLLICVCCRSIATENPTFPGGLREIEFDSAKCTVQVTLGALFHTVQIFFERRPELIFQFDCQSDDFSPLLAEEL
jgi:hypothetical protein